MLQRSWDAVSHRRVQRPCVRISPQDTAPVTPDDPSLRAAQWFSPPNLRDAGYENLISSRPSSALHRKIHRRVVQGKEATSDLRTRLCLRQDEEQEPPQNPKNTGKVILLYYLCIQNLNMASFLFQADYLNSKTSTISIGTQKKWLDLKPDRCEFI